MTAATRCSWCGRAAYGAATAKGLARPLYDCDSDECWHRSYREIRGNVPWTWKLIGRRARVDQPGLDLFDQYREDR